MGISGAESVSVPSEGGPLIETTGEQHYPASNFVASVESRTSNENLLSPTLKNSAASNLCQQALSKHRNHELICNSFKPTKEHSQKSPHQTAKKTNLNWTHNTPVQEYLTSKPKPTSSDYLACLSVPKSTPNNENTSSVSYAEKVDSQQSTQDEESTSCIPDNEATSAIPIQPQTDSSIDSKTDKEPSINKTGINDSKEYIGANEEERHIQGQNRHSANQKVLNGNEEDVFEEMDGYKASDSVQRECPCQSATFRPIQVTGNTQNNQSQTIIQGLLDAASDSPVANQPTSDESCESEYFSVPDCFECSCQLLAPGDLSVTEMPVHASQEELSQEMQQNSNFPARLTGKNKRNNSRTTIRRGSYKDAKLAMRKIVGNRLISHFNGKLKHSLLGSQSHGRTEPGLSLKRSHREKLHYRRELLRKLLKIGNPKSVECDYNTDLYGVWDNETLLPNKNKVKVWTYTNNNIKKVFSSIESSELVKRKDRASSGKLPGVSGKRGSSKQCVMKHRNQIRTKTNSIHKRPHQINNNPQAKPRDSYSFIASEVAPDVIISLKDTKAQERHDSINEHGEQAKEVMVSDPTAIGEIEEVGTSDLPLLESSPNTTPDSSSEEDPTAWFEEAYAFEDVTNEECFEKKRSNSEGTQVSRDSGIGSTNSLPTLDGQSSIKLNNNYTQDACESFASVHSSTLDMGIDGVKDTVNQDDESEVMESTSTVYQSIVTDRTDWQHDSCDDELLKEYRLPVGTVTDELINKITDWDYESNSREDNIESSSAASNLDVVAETKTMINHQETRNPTQSLEETPYHSLCSNEELEVGKESGKTNEGEEFVQNLKKEVSATENRVEQSSGLEHSHSESPEPRTSAMVMSTPRRDYQQEESMCQVRQLASGSELITSRYTNGLSLPSKSSSPLGLGNTGPANQQNTPKDDNSLFVVQKTRTRASQVFPSQSIDCILVDSDIEAHIGIRARSLGTPIGPNEKDVDASLDWDYYTRLEIAEERITSKVNDQGAKEKGNDSIITDQSMDTSYTGASASYQEETDSIITDKGMDKTYTGASVSCLEEIDSISSNQSIYTSCTDASVSHQEEPMDQSIYKEKRLSDYSKYIQVCYIPESEQNLPDLIEEGASVPQQISEECMVEPHSSSLTELN